MKVIKYPLGENESTLHRFCVCLTEPYSTAKQFFEKMVPDLETYEINTYFYSFYSECADEEKDTISNNLNQMFGVYKEKSTEKQAEVLKVNNRIQTTSNGYNRNSDEILQKLIQNYSELFKKNSEYFEQCKRENILFLFLSVIERYNQIIRAVEGRELNKRFDTIDNQIDYLKKKNLRILIFSVLLSTLITLVIFILLLEFYLYDRWNDFHEIFGGIFTSFLAPAILVLLAYLFSELKK